MLETKSITSWSTNDAEIDFSLSKHPGTDLQSNHNTFVKVFSDRMKKHCKREEARFESESLSTKL